MKKHLFIPVLILCALTLSAQEKIEPADSLRKDALKVYMDASDYIKREIPFINYVRDIKDAQIYIISTSQSTGSGGYEYTYFLEGQHDFAGMRDTVVVSTSPDDTDDKRRQKQVSVLKMALMRYVAKTPLNKYIDILFTQPIQEEVSTDQWNNWVFRSNVNGYMSGQKTYQSVDVNGSFSASRITQSWKLIFDLSYSHGEEKYIIGEETILSTNKSSSFDALIVKSLSDHWSVGGEFEIGSSTYRNHQLNLECMPGIEYNIFPYSESTRRQFKFL
jgi:hypothetical protein